MDDADLTEERRAAEAEFSRRAKESLEASRQASAAQVTCEDCEEPLAEFRTRFRFERCVDCQGIWEKRKKFYRSLR